MTQREAQIYWNQWHAFQQRNEKRFAKEFYKALQIQVRAFARTQDVMQIPTFPIYTVLNKLYTVVAPKWARISRDQSLKADDLFVTGRLGFNERIVELMRQYYGVNLLNDAELMTQYSREVIARVLSKAAETGASFDDVVAELLRHPEFSAMRARRIARTETVTAANAGAMVYAQNSGNVMEKVWIAVKDKRTRHSHRDIDGTRLDIDTAFNMPRSQQNAKYGDISMQQPGARQQPNGLPVPAVEVVNCRCTVAFQAKRDSRGNIIRR